MNELYRIKWYAIKTGKSGYGNGAFSIKKAKMYAESMNAEEEKKGERLMIYSVEKVSNENKQS